MNEPTKLLLVESDRTIRQDLAARLDALPGIHVVATAQSCRTAEPKLVSYSPAIVVLDCSTNVEEALALISGYSDLGRPFRVLALPDNLEASRLSDVSGRLDNIILARPGAQATPEQLDEFYRSIESAVITLAGGPKPVAETVAPTNSLFGNGGIKIATPSVVGIGVSTGGPLALARLLPAIPANFPLPILIVQHMPKDFTGGLAQSLDEASQLTVREAVDGECPTPGVALIAPGGKHMQVRRDPDGCRIELTEDPPVCSCRPSVDVLFRSLGKVFGSRVLSVVLTGMGEDGWASTKELADQGGCVLAQNEESCTVYGMPRGPIESGVARPVHLNEMANAIIESAGSLVCS